MEPNNSNSMLNGLPLTPKDGKKIGPILGVLVIVLVIIIAALYFFSQNLNTKSTPTESSPVVVEEMDETSNSTSSEAIGNDAAAIQAELDMQLKDIDYSF